MTLTFFIIDIFFDVIIFEDLSVALFIYLFAYLLMRWFSGDDSFVKWTVSLDFYDLIYVLWTEDGVIG